MFTAYAYACGLDDMLTGHSVSFFFTSEKTSGRCLLIIVRELFWENPVVCVVLIASDVINF